MLFRREGLWPAVRRVAALSREQQTAAAEPRGRRSSSRGRRRRPARRAARPLLEIEGLTKRFGGVAAADGITLNVNAGELVSVIGPNGSGKTTLFNLITGLAPRDGGTIRLEGAEISGLPSHEIVQRGVARTFQNIRLFNNLSVLENLLVGEHARLQAGALGAIFRPPSVREEERRAVESALEVLGALRQPPDPPAGPPRVRPLLREPAPDRDRAGDHDAPEAPPARRAGRGHEPGRDPRAHGPREGAAGARHHRSS